MSRGYWYNGFGMPYQMAQSKKVTYAIRKGRVERPTKCLTCCQTSGIIMGHQEDYDFPHAYFPLCYVCHKMLHARYDSPELWARYRNALHIGYRSPVFTAYDWRTFNRVFASDDWQSWPGEWSEELGDETLFRLLPMTDLRRVPDGLRVSAGDPLLPGQYRPIADLWPGQRSTPTILDDEP